MSSTLLSAYITEAVSKEATLSSFAILGGQSTGFSSPFPVVLLQIASILPKGRITLLHDTENGFLGYDVYDGFFNVPATKGINIISCNLEDDEMINELEQLFKIKATLSIVVLCLENTTAELFNIVAEKGIYLKHVNWLVFTRGAIEYHLAKILKEGIRVALVVPSNSGNFEIKKITILQNDIVRAIGFGKSFKSSLRMRMSEDLFQDLKKEYKDFGGRTLTVASIGNTIIMSLQKKPNGRYLAINGFDYYYVDSLSKVLNFKYEVVFGGSESRPEQGIIYPNGTVTGVLGLVHHRKVHIGAHSLMILEQRAQLVDFPMPPYYFAEFIIVRKKLSKKENFFAVLSPFSIQIWTICIACMFLVSLVLALLSKIVEAPADIRLYLMQSIGHAYVMLLGQSLESYSTKISIRIVILFTLLFTLVFRVLYSGILTSFLIFQPYEKPVDNLEDAIWAVKNNGYSIGTAKSSEMWDIFENSVEGTIYRKVWNLFDENSPGGPLLDNLAEKALNEKYLVILPDNIGQAFVLNFGKLKFYVSKERFYSNPCGLLIPKGAPYFDIIGKKTSQLVAGGLVHYWIQKLLFLKELKTPYVTKHEDDEGRSLTLSNMKSAFVILVIGLILAMFVFFLELVVKKRTNVIVIQKLPRKV